MLHSYPIKPESFASRVPTKYYAFCSKSLILMFPLEHLCLFSCILLPYSMCYRQCRPDEYLRKVTPFITISQVYTLRALGSIVLYRRVLFCMDLFCACIQYSSSLSYIVLHIVLHILYCAAYFILYCILQ